MKFVFSAFLMTLSLYVFGQNSVIDSLSGGEYHIESIAQLDSLINNSVKETCSRPRPDQNPDTEIDICARTPKVLGYKIQILYTKDRSVAERTLANFSRNYPDLIAEMQYSRPDYRVLAGDFFTKRTAARDLSRVKKEYPGALLVQWRVFCRRAK